MTLGNGAPVSWETADTRSGSDADMLILSASASRVPDPLDGPIVYLFGACAGRIGRLTNVKNWAI